MIRGTLPRLALSSLVLALTCAAAPAAALEANLLPVGSPAPMIVSEDIEGRPFALADALKEGPALLVFWSLFCGSCMEELPIIQQELPNYAGKVQVVAVNLDEAPRARSVRMVAQQKGFTFRIILNKVESKDAGGAVAKREFQIDTAFKVTATPALYLVNRDGTIGFGHYGPMSPEELAEVVAKAR